MAIFKCKMCGGALEINNNETVATCEYCGTQQTLPKLDDDRRANLYDRANHFRRNNEFDKAMGIYENILNEDNTDAEAYWSLVLCRYGIEYVEDPSSHKRIPTVNRAQFTSIFDDDNYKSALQYADGYQRSIYEEEAKAINEIQKGILAISQKEEPFDVFVCYKETDSNGRRTPDSVLANDLYHQLTQEGFKVFFARITLEDKLGVAYEPYIFAALNSAKVMVALGTKPEYFNAVWVKNEWSRYLALIKNGAKKILIPAYKDMDPYDLPEEFSHLQAQDMSRLGFMQDLIRGIKKITQADVPKTTVVKETVMAGGSANTAPLLKRVFMFLEDGDWDSTDEYCEKVLDIDPENALAYLGKLLSELRVRRQEALKDQAEPFDGNSNYQKAMRFADETLKSVLIGYIEHINTRNENERLAAQYESIVRAMNMATTEDDYKAVAERFAEMGTYSEAARLAKECLEKAEAARIEALERAETARRNTIYANACQLKAKNTIRDLEQAIAKFREISGWKDSQELIYACEKRISEIKTDQEKRRLEKERQDELARIALENRIQRTRTFFKVAIPTVAGVIACILLMVLWIIPAVKFNDAVSLMEEGKYNEARMIFVDLGGFSTSEQKIVVIDAITNKTIKYNSNDKTVTLNNPTQEGYTFIGWTGANLTELTMNVTIPAVSYGDYEYTANWKPNEYTFALNANEGEVNEATVTADYNSLYTLPTPTRDYYRFDGWYDGAEKYENGTWYKACNVTLTAKWSPVYYTITYNSAGTNSSQNPSRFTVESSTISLDDPKKEGYKFLGWYTDKDYSHKVTEIPAGSHENISLYAKWEIITYTITYKLNGGTISGTKKTTFTVQDLPLTLDTPAKTNYVFLGWKENDYYGADVATITACGNITLYAAYMDVYLQLSLHGYSNKYYTVDKYSGNATVVDIPAYYEGYPIQEIDWGAFKDKTKITTINIPSTVQEIGNSAFSGCSSLKNITIPDGVKKIGSSAFSGCSSLTSIIIPDTVTSIGESAFAGCTALKTVQLSNSLTTMENKAFENCSSLTSIEIPGTLKEIAYCTFSGCRNLKTVILNEGLQEISFGAFSSSKITKLIIPKSVTRINEDAFDFYNYGACSNIVFYCRATTMPSGWDSGWDLGRPVTWGYTGD